MKKLMRKKDKLEENLKNMFQYIKTKHNTKLGQLTLDQVREYWWALNRNDVWKAITCGVTDGDKYFRDTCSKGGTYNKCHCNDGDVLTNFDYVPQFLRWFEEWAEDFCRLRKHKLKDAIQKCRYPNSSEKYCDLNRYDCERTIRGDHDFVEDDVCKGCQYSCSHFVNWIDNQKLEFLKQKNKYDKEKKQKDQRTITTTHGTINNMYADVFYNKLQEHYPSVDAFLELLNKEKECENQPDIEGVKSSVDFNKELRETFYRTKYCEACPWCGAKKVNGQNGKWEDIQDTKCGEGRGYNDYEKTEIPILTGDKTEGDMVKKYKKFCNGNGEKGANGASPTATIRDNSDKATTGYCGTNNSDPSLCEKWICYYKKIEKDGGKKEINFCVLQDGNQHKKDRKDKSYDVFFYSSIIDMLNDSIEWRAQLNSCINNGKKDCISKCNSRCDCYRRWIEKKKEEFEKIKDHFGKQEDVEHQNLNNRWKKLKNF
ncbi:hypothetical protein PFTANZ_06106 [Plasmodium falciparum Tanzania (2000708)]|uniref:Uncharacterized protein n=1 Tax=Plasmodium falciparum Tanzania (2000708) TaxID=1036725 RepID=A0A024VZ30_PLAFA|nr:hypothetical protein PFTANZ_06106 [Plasmodium falciparum Tanzania (2000708)]